MIAYVCNKCKKSINLSKKCIHLHISCGERAITSVGKFGDSWDADLCEDCAVQLLPYIDDYYYGGNEYLKAEIEKYKQECSSKNIDELEFSVRVYRCLKIAHIETEDELLNCSLSELKEMKNMGKKMMIEVIEKLF